MEEILRYNKEFVAREGYKPYAASKYPAKKIAIVTCMDTRLVALLPAALGIKNGDVKMIKNAGGIIPSPWDSTMKSLLVAIYELGVEKVMIIGHTTCGVEGMEGKEMIELMEKRGIASATISLIKSCGIKLEKWLTGFEDTAGAVKESVALVRHHPLIPEGIDVAGFIMDTLTGELTPVD